MPIENEWNHVKVIFFNLTAAASMPIEIGIHVFKQKSSDQDILFTDPYTKKRVIEMIQPFSPPSILDFDLNFDLCAEYFS